MAMAGENQRRDHFRWLGDHYQMLTVIADAKAGFVIALHGAIAAGTFQGANLFRDTSGRLDPKLSAWGGALPIILVLLALGYILTAGLSLKAALDVIVPRRRDPSGGKGAPVVFFGAVAQLDDQCDPGGEWIAALQGTTDKELDERFAGDLIAMARILDTKLERAGHALRMLRWAMLLWVVLAVTAVVVASVRG